MKRTIKYLTTTVRASLALPIALLASGASLQAAQIFANTSFEGGNSTGWTLSGNQSGYSDAIGKATDFGITVNPNAGEYVLKLNGTGGFAYQAGTATIAANTSYTLSYDIWLSSSNPQWSGQSRAYFYLGNDQYGGPTSSFYSSGVGGIADPAADYLAAGQWYSVSRTVDASYIATNPSLYGETIGVAFSINPQGSGGITYYVDNVQLTAIPEPSSFAMVLGGIANLLLIRRRRTA
jgi:hypothetical protein